MKTARQPVVFVGTLLLIASHALAWEADTHYGFVKWLAYQAGFSLQDAEIIAASSEAADETHVLMATYLIAEVCARGKAPKLTTVSRVVQQHHFPSPEPVPNQPMAREVLPGLYGRDGGGNRWIRQEIEDRTTSLASLVRLERFGSAIHPLADVASHPCSALPFELIRNDYSAENADGQPIMVASYLVTFTVKHAPRDLLMLTIERLDNKWKLTSIAWAVQ